VISQLDDLYASKIVKCKEKIKNIKSLTYVASTTKHLRSDHSNIAAYFGL